MEECGHDRCTRWNIQCVGDAHESRESRTARTKVDFNRRKAHDSARAIFEGDLRQHKCLTACKTTLVFVQMTSVSNRYLLRIGMHRRQAQQQRSTEAFRWVSFSSLSLLFARLVQYGHCDSIHVRRAGVIPAEHRAPSTAQNSTAQ